MSTLAASPSNKTVKPGFLVAAALVAFALLATLSLAQGLKKSEFTALATDYSSPRLVDPHVGPVVLYNAGLTNSLPFPGPLLVLSNHPTSLFAKPGRSRLVPPRAPAPGVYLAKPYSMIVVVPGPHPDDKCIVSPSGPVAPMPVIPPELHLVPFHTK